MQLPSVWRQSCHTFESTTMSQAPGFFTTARLLFSGVTGSLIQTAKLGEDLAATGRLALIPTQADSIQEAKASLGTMSLEEFRQERKALLD